MNRLALILMLMLSSTAYAAVQKETVRSGVEIKPGEHQLITIDSNEDLEVGWITTQEKRCTMNCVEAVDKSGGFESKISTEIGASVKYKPANGKIVIDYVNKADHPVTIDIYKTKRTCEAEACALLKNDQSQRALVFKIGEFKSITTSVDGSYSTISGVTTTGQEFTVKAVWWTTDPDAMRFTCNKAIKGYLDKQSPPAEYSPYILSGRASGYNDNMVLDDIDTCVPQAPNFGVSEDSVYKGPVKLADESFDPKVFTSHAEFDSEGRKLATESAFAVFTDQYYSGQVNAVEIRFFKDMLTADGKYAILNQKNAPYDVLMILFFDKKENKLYQVDVTYVIPGFTSAYTVAWKPEELKKYFSDYIYDGKNLKLKTKGDYFDKDVKKLSWDVNVDIPVFDNLNKAK